MGDPIELEPVTDPDGRTRYVAEPLTGHTSPPEAGPRIVLEEGVVTGPGERGTTSKIPTDTMSGGDQDYNAIVAALSAFEEGRDPGAVPLAEPGGELVLHRDGGTPVATTKLPTDTMAAVAEPVADRAWIQRFDPSNRCSWQWQDSDVLPGWYFTLAPLADLEWKFFAARHPSYGGRHLAVIIAPDYTKLTGHRDHVLTWNVAGRGSGLPIICKSGNDNTVADLSEAHGLAAKFRLRNGILAGTGHAPFSR